METKIINLPYLNDTFPILATDLVDRSGYIDAIQSALERNDVVFITGDEGLGKTTLLAQFCILEQFNCISHFITPSIRITYNPQCVEYNLLNQIYFYCNNTKLEDDNNISKFGLLQEIETVEDKDISLARNIANNRLKELNRVNEDISIKLLGDDTVRAGRIINIDNDMFKMNGQYLVKDCTHSYHNRVHTMDLTLGAM